jgi:hypothetical protein
MRPMKEVGLTEIQSARSRARKLWGMNRINRTDFQYIDQRLDEVEARIVSMRELDEYGKEVHE